MPVATDIIESPVEEPITAPKPEEKKTGKGRTRFPPKTLPADFDFGSAPNSSSIAAAASSPSQAPPKTLPANFNFDSPSPAAAPDASSPLDKRLREAIDSGQKHFKEVRAEQSKSDSEWYKRLPWYDRVAASFNENFGVPASVQRNPMEALKGIGLALRHPSLEMESLQQMYQSMDKAQQEVIDRAYSLQHAPGAANKANGFVMGVYASVPLFGPAIVNAADRWASGDKAGAVGALSAIGTQVLAPHAENIHPIEAVKRAGSEIAGKVSSKAQASLQRATSTGPRMAEKIAEKAVADTQAANVTEIEKSAKAAEKHAESQADYDTKISRINEDYDGKIAKTRQQYADDVAARDKKVSELQAQHADKVAEARRDWVQRTHESREATREQVKVEGRREALKSQQKAYADLIKENVKDAHTNTRAELDSRWGKLRETVGTESPVSPSGIVDAVEKSRAMLAGIPSDLKIFNDVFKEITEPSTSIESADGPKPAPREYISFDNARTQYSAIGEKAYTADGNLRRALFNVYDAYDQALTKTATDAGAGKQYAAVKKDWSQYMKDWHDGSSMASGGSPLARVYRAVDNDVVTDNVKGKFGDRLFGTFARYDKYGANPALMPKLRNSVQEAAALPKVKIPKAPDKFESPTAPKSPEPVESPEAKTAELEAQRAKTIERTDQPKAPPPPKLSPNPTMDELVAMVKKAKVDKAKDYISGTKWHAYDTIMATWVAFDIPHILSGEMSHAAAHAALWVGGNVGWRSFIRSPIGMEWMTKVTPADVKVMSEVLAKVPGEKVEFGKAAAEAMSDTARAGGPAPNIAKFSPLLTPDEQREVMKSVKDINELKARGIKPPDLTAGAAGGAGRVPESSSEAGGSGAAAGAAADNADIAQARKNLNLAPGQWDNRLLSEAQKIKDQRQPTPQAKPQGGHAGGGVSSVEELNRQGVNYVVSKSGQITYHGKSFAPESTAAGSTHVTVMPDGTIRVNAGQSLTPAQEMAVKKAAEK